jgi:hypothetical protein
MRQFRIQTGYRGADQRADEQPRQQQDHRLASAAAGLAIAPRQADSRTEADRPAGRSLFATAGAGCPCCKA